MEPLNSAIQAACLQFWIPGRDVTVDECISRFKGHSHDTLTIPSKPTPTGYKIWAIAQKRYILSWL